MEVRAARTEDMAGILEYLQEYHEASNLSEVKFIRQDMAKVLDAFIGSRDCCSLVAKKDDGSTVGVLFGSLQPYMFNRRKTWATDLLFIADGAGPALLRRFKQWAWGVGAERIIMGVSSGHSRAGQLIELSGGNPLGGMYEFRR